VLKLAAALGVRNNGTFLEVGGNDGLKASNTLHTEFCRGWRGILIEANYVSFAKMLRHRPGTMAVRGAVCSQAGTVTFATRMSKHTRRVKGYAAPSVDETGGIVEHMGRTFERAGYTTSAPSAWLSDPTRGMRLTVPCEPLSQIFLNVGLRRLDVMWLDVEGGERLVLESIDWSSVSIGILVVEMRFNDARNNRAIVRLLHAAGFELVRSLAVWGYQLIDNVFLRAEHFLGGGLGHGEGALTTATSVPRRVQIPRSVSVLLKSLPRNIPVGANRKLLPGIHCCTPYTVKLPLSMLSCMPENVTTC
jgi:FkbM family methyltransferase